jgi:hypothetical protein
MVTAIDTSSAFAARARGTGAERALATLPVGVPIIAADVDGVGSALIDAVEFRRAGIPFAAFPLVEDERIEAARVLGVHALGIASDLDGRRTAMDRLAAQELAVNGRPQTDLRLFDPRRQRALRDFALLGDVVVVRSQRERERVERLAATFGPSALPRTFVALTDADARLKPPARRPRADAVLIWAPDALAETCTVLAFALEEWHAPLYVCAAGGTLPGLRATIVSPQESAALWETIGTVVVADPYDPAPALSFVNAGYAVAASRASGVDEWAQGVALYDAWNHLSVNDAVSDAAGSAQCRRLRCARPAEELRAALDASVPAIVAEPPLVTLVVPTRDRRGVLPRSLASVAAQTYPNIEVVVVNDGGPLGDLVEGFRFPLRVIDGEGAGLNAAFTLGMRAARGVYVGIQPDDDPLFADHVARLVEALERNRAWMAHSRPIAAMVEGNGRRGYDLAGYEVVHDAPVDPLHFRWRNTIANTALFRREALERYGWYDDAVGYVSDYDLWLRIFERHDLVHVPVVTAELIWRSDESNTSLSMWCRNPELYRALYERHPAPGRPLLESLRQHHFALFTQPFTSPAPGLRLEDARCRDWLGSLDLP